MFFTVFTNIFFSLVFIGGMIAWLKKGSLISLIASGISALLLALGIYWFDTQPQYYAVSVWILGLTSGMLVVFALSRLIRTGKLMPAGLILLLSTAELGLLWIRISGY